MNHHNGTARGIDYVERYNDAQVQQAADELREQRRERFADDTGPSNESANDFWKRGERLETITHIQPSGIIQDVQTPALFFV